jgi:hypothetical protein
MLPPPEPFQPTEVSMPTKPLYVVCVFNLYAHEPDEPQETPEQRAERRRTYHCAGFSPEAALELAWVRFGRCCDYNWTYPALLGEFPTRTEGGWEVADVETLTCPHCGQTF